jgi:membrane protease YdiL (CAAX protease family)
MTAFPLRYAPLAAFVAPAKGRTELWRTLGGLAVMVFVYVFALRLLSSAILSSLNPIEGILVLQDMALGTSPRGVVELLWTDLGLTLGLALACWLVLHRSIFSLIGPPAAAWRCFLWAAGPLCLLSVLLLPLQVMAPNVTRQLDLWRMVRWLPLALPGLLIQTGTEELVFRGYLQQQLAARWRQPWVWMAIPAALFGALHWAPQDYGALAPLVVVWAVAFGLATADLTARTGNLGAAVGLHFAANAQSLLMLGLYGNLSGLSLFTIALSPADPLAGLPYLAIDTASLLVSWLAIRVILRV